VNNTEEAALVWELAEAASSFLPPHSRSSLWTRIGAGEREIAIKDLLHFFVWYEREVPASLASRIQVWSEGYRGSDSELPLRSLVRRIRGIASAPVDC
jgi:hypothetical protein